jgi:quinol monooxygenase YgiN
MILVTGSILAKAESLDKLLALSLEHVRRSRTEPGCVLHSVHQDAENPLRLVFLEEWTDKAALAAHFVVPASREFVKTAMELAVTPPVINIYEATTVEM